MGYSGFGLKKEEYTGEPKKAFNEEKELFNNTLGNHSKISKQKLLDQYLKEIENLRSKRKLKISESRLGMLMTLSLMFIIYFLFVWISG